MLDVPLDLIESAPQFHLVDAVPLSVAFWALIDPDGFGSFAVGTDDGGGESGWAVVAIEAGSINMRFQVNRATSLFEIDTDDSFTETVVNHFCVSWTGALATGSGRWWINGVESGVSYQVGSGAHDSGLATPFLIGGGFFGTAQIGWVSVWNRLISDAEVKQLALRRSALHFPDGLIGYWRLNRSSYVHPDIVGNVPLTPDGGDVPDNVWNGIDIIDPPTYRSQSHKHNTPPDESTVFPLRRNMIKMR